MIFVKFKVSSSPLGGKGVFSRQQIPRGQKVLRFDGELVSWETAKQTGRENHVVPVGLNRYTDGELECLVNHSCDPNTGFIDDVTLVSVKDLKVGDEITYDYSLVTADGWSMKCHCGSPRCRGMVGDYVDLPAKVKEKYKNLTPPWMLAIDGNQ